MDEIGVGVIFYDNCLACFFLPNKSQASKQVSSKTDDSCLVFRDNNINEIEKQLNENFNSLCDWFVDNKLSIHF